MKHVAFDLDAEIRGTDHTVVYLLTLPSRKHEIAESLSGRAERQLMLADVGLRVARGNNDAA